MVRAFIREAALRCHHVDRETIYFSAIPNGVKYSSLVSYGSVTLVCRHMNLGTIYYLPILGGIHRDSPALYGSCARGIPHFLLVDRLYCTYEKSPEPYLYNFCI